MRVLQLSNTDTKLSNKITFFLLCFVYVETGILVPRFRWRRSQWSRYCPVELAKGNMIPGRMEFSVG